MTRLLLLVVMIPSLAAAADKPADQADISWKSQWIWPTRERVRGQYVLFRAGFFTPTEIKSAKLYVVGDAASATVYINNRQVAHADAFGPMVEVDVTQFLRGRDDLMEVRSLSKGDCPAINVRLIWTDAKGRSGGGGTDGNWLAAEPYPEEWPKGPVLDHKIRWEKVVTFGALEEEPWGHLEDRIAINPFDDYEQWRQATGAAEGTDPASFLIAPGFEIERLRSAGKDEGSWVSLTFDPKGRLLIAREDKGLLRLTLPKQKGGDIKVESINDTLRECRGMEFVGNDLYVNANNDKVFMRLRDTDGDDRFDELTKIYESAGGVGHGRNDLTPGPDGFLYMIQGDSVAVPKDMPTRLSPLRFAGRPKAGEGFVYRFDPRKLGARDVLRQDTEVIAESWR